MTTNKAYIPAAMRRALLRTNRQGADPTTREGVQVLLRELFEGERLYLKELPQRPVGRRLAGRPAAKATADPAK